MINEPKKQAIFKYITFGINLLVLIVLLVLLFKKTPTQQATDVLKQVNDNRKILDSISSNVHALDVSIDSLKSRKHKIVVNEKTIIQKYYEEYSKIDNASDSTQRILLNGYLSKYDKRREDRLKRSK